MTTTTLAAVEYWEHIVDAVCYAITDEPDAAHRALMLAGRLGPMPDEAYRAITSVDFTDPALETAHSMADHFKREYDAIEDLHARAVRKCDQLTHERDTWKRRYAVAEAAQNRLANEVSALTKMLIDSGHLDLIEQHAKQKREAQ